jgi:uncharacterized protein YqgV (UPF0045/DUF77 family)
MDWITILGVLKSAIDIVKSIPEVQKAGQHVVDQINKLIGKGGGKAPQGPLATLIEGQAKRLKTLVDEFASKDADPRFDNIEKAAFRRRVAAQARSLLESSAPIKDSLPDYDALLAFFDSAAKSA